MAAVGLQARLADQIGGGLRPAPRLDAMSGATPLDALKTALKLGEGSGHVAALLADQDGFRQFRRRGWEWVTAGYLLGGLWLWQRKASSAWHAPLRFHRRPACWPPALAVNPHSSPTRCSTSSPAAPCSAPSSSSPTRSPAARRRKGKLIFGFSAGVLAYIIRVFGGYPDGVAFAVLLMNLCVPLIDLYTQPPIFGMKDKS
jgi:electron transport complex protein RnfD